MSRAGAVKVYAGLLLLLALQLACALYWPRLGAVIMLAAAVQCLLLLWFYLGLYRHRGWARLFGWVYLLWLLVMVVFILGEVATR
ncbi:hypothetical protein YA0745_01565 [Pseudomonas synxantha]|uniref:Uncharacterized protein n=1 Tax=Pseudomonas synxantha TaxID=47883 RepID=A0ABS0UCX8_9PSED|nr:hypothetical protein [Pseudomonas synxantha]MBI6563415.1 hypothetical protein [Pseudomonas synxantha]MBI6584129.1 hypothetical protein [Pseudomonas synxantha]MBI6641644.1 hypothetical protein [Pseudomonas synxantha]